MLQDAPPPPAPDAPSAAVSNNKVTLALLAPPSPASPASHQRTRGVTTLYQDGAEKHHSDLPSTRYFPAKKKGRHIACIAGGGSCTRSDGISPCNPFNVLDDDKLEACNNDNDDNKGDPNYLPTPMYKKISQVACKPKTCNPKVVLGSSYFAFLCPLMFNTKQFSRGHPQVYSQEEMCQLDANFQKQLTFNFCALHARRKKSATINEVRASCLCNVDLYAMPTSF
jgi:hypothetical protein